WTLLGVGVVATVSHLCLSYSLRYAPAATVAPLQYLEILGATIIGYLVFGDFPGQTAWLGIAIIVGSGLFVFHRERAADRRAYDTANQAMQPHRVGEKDNPTARQS
ncbi:MAG: DMT family transporter, partial [Primorskyibacter sp.]